MHYPAKVASLQSRPIHLPLAPWCHVVAFIAFIVLYIVRADLTAEEPVHCEAIIDLRHCPKVEWCQQEAKMQGPATHQPGLQEWNLIATMHIAAMTLWTNKTAHLGKHHRTFPQIMAHRKMQQIINMTSMESIIKVVNNKKYMISK